MVNALLQSIHRNIFQCTEYNDQLRAIPSGAARGRAKGNSSLLGWNAICGSGDIYERFTGRVSGDAGNRGSRFGFGYWHNKNRIMNDELLFAFLSVDQPQVGKQSSRNQEWQTLFNYYNENSGEKHLHMSCGICFHKVWHFCRQRLRASVIARLAISESESKLKSDEFRSQNIV